MKTKELSIQEITLVILCKSCHRLIRINYVYGIGKPLSLSDIKRNAMLIHDTYPSCKKDDMVITNLPI